MKKLKILYIACGNGSDPTIGGSLLRTAEIASRLSKEHTVSILTSTGGKVALAYLEDKCEIIEIKTNCSKSGNENFFLTKIFFSYLILLIKMPRVVRNLKFYDIVYTDSDGIWDITPALMLKLKNKSVKFVSMNHHLITIRKDHLVSFFFSLINRTLQIANIFLIKRFSDAIFVLDTSMGNEIALEYSQNKYMGEIFRVQNGVDCRLISQLEHQPKKYDACFFGYLRPSKGLYQIAPIWKLVVERMPNAKLIIIGGMLTQYRKYLEQEIKRLSLESNILFSSYQPNKIDALKLVKSSKVNISPSQEEGWGIALSEAMAAGLPSVTWSLESYQNVFTAGLLQAKEPNLKDFSQAIINLLENNSLREDLGTKASACIAMYDWNNVARMDLDHFINLCET